MMILKDKHAFVTKNAPKKVKVKKRKDWGLSQNFALKTAYLFITRILTLRHVYIFEISIKLSILTR
jgi:hypothetical protein